MTPIKFKESNIIFAENQPEYLPLPAFKKNNPQGEVVSCWKLSFIERMRVLFKGVIWLNLLSFNKPLTPLMITTKKEDLI